MNTNDMLRDVDPRIAAVIAPYLRCPQVIADAASQEVQRSPLKAYLVVIGTKNRVRLRLPVMAHSSAEAQAQHECLMLPGERCKVLPHANRGALRPELDGLRQVLRAKDLNQAEIERGAA